MSHIILECKATGQETIWTILKDLWALTKHNWVSPTWGMTFGAACTVFKSREGTRSSATESLWTILCTESLHLVWKLRCERVIQNEGSDFMVQEVTNRFYACINSRLDLDRRTTALARGTKALKPADAERIWRPVLDNYDALPPNWVVDGGVLVGIKRGR
ncbi:hypothetical protein K466DRAFT_633672 [Polyporus arcularius HHB13444]|uniref:Uncharacterized protein n=1 Tax=Polyporus arcularius HHB13444 TaxID=1314778 RepID=A0A5C3NXX2_9APHY|nr:hypothetical protein K466DRAFT_633672 [Polyporus arcularius HHB13444]